MSFNNRQEYNKEILKILSEYIEKNPDIRFSQAILNLNITKRDDTYSYKDIWIDEFYLESKELLERIIK